MQAWPAPVVHRLPASQPPIQVHGFDTGSQQVVPLARPGGTARMYVCGITPYDATHLGHANTYVAFDLLNRIWRDTGSIVEYVQNVTDIDDPLLERAHDTGVDWQELAREQTALYAADMAALHVLPPEHFVGAVESIALVTKAIGALQERGAIYPVADPDYPDLYFSRSSDPEFGSLSRLSDRAAVSVFAERGGDPDRPGKSDPLDCLVWRRQRPGEPGWDSPFGRGRPGWHIECTALALDLLGADFDVQGGGSDLVFPHHEMCAAEARVLTGEEFAKAYLHAGMVGLDGEKMSKSRGNLVFVSSLREGGVDPMVIRLALLSHHYREDWMWSPHELDRAKDRLERWREAVRLGAGVNADEVLFHVRAALAYDLDAPTALAAVDAWAGASTSIDGDDTEAPALVARICDTLLGVRLDSTDVSAA